MAAPWRHPQKNNVVHYFGLKQMRVPQQNHGYHNTGKGLGYFFL